MDNKTAAASIFGIGTVVAIFVSLGIMYNDFLKAGGSPEAKLLMRSDERGFALIELLDQLAGADQLVDDRWPADVRRLVRRVLRGAIAETVRAVDDAQAEELRKIVDDGHEAMERLQALDMSELRRRVRELQAARASLDEARSFGIARLPELDATALGQLEHPDRLAP